MTDRDKIDRSSEEYTAILLESIENKYQAILEAIAPIPKMQEDISTMKNWESDIKLIPAIFEEVGSLRKEVETLKEAFKLLDRDNKQLTSIEQRLLVLEQKVGV